MWWRQPTACMTGATSWRWRAVPSSVWWLESTITANTMRWEHHQKDKTNKQTLPNNTNNKQVMVGEHDHCKHNEVKTSWEKKNKTNKQRKQKTKKATTKWWLGRTTTASTTRWEMHRTTSTTSKKQTATKIHINIMAASTTWWQVVRCINRNHDNNKQIVWNNNIIKQQQQMTNNIKIIKQQTSSTKNNIIKQQTTIRPAARATCSPLQCTNTLSSTRTSPLTTTSQSWRWQQRKSIIWCWSLP